MTTRVARTTEVDQLFADWLLDARTSAGLSQARLGELTKMRQATISKIENAEQHVSLTNAVLITGALGRALPDFTPLVKRLCPTCHATPPEGFTCNECGGSGEG